MELIKDETSALIRLTERPSPDLHQRSNQFCCERAVKHKDAVLKPQTRVAEKHSECHDDQKKQEVVCVGEKAACRCRHHPFY